MAATSIKGLDEVRMWTQGWTGLKPRAVTQDGPWVPDILPVVEYTLLGRALALGGVYI